MKLWIDDVREPPDSSWVWCRTVTEAFVTFWRESVKEISFDHDMGAYGETTMIFAKVIEELASGGDFPRIKWAIHSQNPVGRENLKATLKSADAFWDNWEKKVSDKTTKA